MRFVLACLNVLLHVLQFVAVKDKKVEKEHLDLYVGLQLQRIVGRFKLFFILGDDRTDVLKTHHTFIRLLGVLEEKLMPRFFAKMNQRVDQ